MNSLNARLSDELLAKGADLVGFGDLTGLDAGVRAGLPNGISVAVKFPKEIITGITELPTPEYYEWYKLLNDRLDMLVTAGAQALKGLGYNAVAQTRAQVGSWETALGTVLPHKTVATHAGLGWIGKCALLVTERFGSMVRLSSILTDAPVETAEPVEQSKCGGCDVCERVCPAAAVSGRAWQSGMYRDEFFDARKCWQMTLIRSKMGLGQEISICGRCIAACPYTKRYIEAADLTRA